MRLFTHGIDVAGNDVGHAVGCWTSPETILRLRIQQARNQLHLLRLGLSGNGDAKRAAERLAAAVDSVKQHREIDGGFVVRGHGGHSKMHSVAGKP